MLYDCDSMRGRINDKEGKKETFASPDEVFNYRKLKYLCEETLSFEHVNDNLNKILSGKH